MKRSEDLLKNFLSVAGEEPPMDNSEIGVIASVNREDWEFRTKPKGLGLGHEIRTIVERIEEEEGQYQRIHETLKVKKHRYA